MAEIQINPLIRIRLIERTDASSFFGLIEENRVYLRNWLAWLDGMKSITIAEKYIDSRLKLASEKAGFCFLIISKNAIAGVVHLVDIDQANRKAMIGYWVGQAFAGQGFATDATKAVIDFAFSELKLHRIEIKCAVGNIGSEAIPKKLKFRCEGVLREAEWLHSRFVDQNLYSLLSNEWLLQSI